MLYTLTAFCVAASVYLALEGYSDYRRRHPPKDAPTAALLDDMFGKLKTDPYVRQQETQDAVEKVANLARDDVFRTSETWFALGLYSQAQRDYRTAERAYRDAIYLSPRWSWPYTGLGIVLHELNRDPEAEEAFRRAIALDPQWGRPYNDLAILLRTLGRYDEAEENARKAVDLDPMDMATHNNLANLLVSEGKLDEAEKAYQAAILLSQNHPAPYYNLACLYSIEGRTKEALDVLEKAFALDTTLIAQAKKDPDLATVRKDSAFRKLTRKAVRKPTARQAN